MTAHTPPSASGVGPVLSANGVGRAVLEAILELNPGVQVTDRGAYYRVHARGSCALTCEAVERLLGRPFALPGDLEAVMPSFRGELCIAAGRVEWRGREP